MSRPVTPGEIEDRRTGSAAATGPRVNAVKDICLKSQDIKNEGSEEIEGNNERDEKECEPIEAPLGRRETEMKEQK